MAMLSLSALAVAAAGAPAHGQTALDDAVANRSRPDFDAQCIRAGAADPTVEAGGIVICPTVNITTQYEDNVFRDATNERGDISATISPALSVATDLDAHALSVTGAIAATRYASEDNNDSTDYTVSGSGRLDVAADVSTTLGLSAGRFHRDRGDPDSSGAGQDVDKFTSTSESLGLTYAPSDFSFTVTVGARQLDFSNTGTVNNDDQDRAEYTAAFRAGLGLGSGLSVFIRPRIQVTRYDQRSAGVTRDSDGYDIQAGASYDLSGVTFVEVGVGAFSRDFDDPTFGDASGASVSGRVVWNPTDLQTVTLTADRGLSETAQVGASSIIDTSVGATVDFDVAENVALNTSLSYANQEFQDDPRDDDVWRAGIGAQLFINEYARATAGVAHERRRSSVAGNDFDANTFTVGLNLQF